MSLIRPLENRHNMLPTVVLVRLPEMTKNKSNEDRNRMDENVKQFCANCGLQDDSIVRKMVVDIKIPQQVNSNLGQLNYEKKRVMRDVHTALSSIYKLDCFKKFPPDEDDILKDNDEPMVICKSCSTVLIPLYKLLEEFNHLRSMDSILQQKIVKLDSRLQKILQNGIKEEPDSDEEFNPELEESQLKDQEMDQDSDSIENNNNDDEKLPDNFLSVEMSTSENTSEEEEEEQNDPLANEDDEWIPPSTERIFHDEPGQIFSCPKCHKKFKSRHNHTAHIKICKIGLMSSIHKTLSKVSKQPSIIDDQPESDKNPNQPAKTSRVELKCDLCGRKMGNQSAYKIHMKRHAGDCQFPCPFPGCTKSFVTASDLKLHEQTRHPVDKNAFICETCGKGFPLQKFLNRHIKNSHEKDSLIPCPSCPRRLNSQAALERHLKKSCSKEKPKFICDECGKMYKSVTCLQLHMRFHAGDALICPRPDCGKKYYDKTTLQVHLQVIHGEKSFKCPNCDHAAISSTILNEHIAIKHPELPKDPEIVSQVCPVRGIKLFGSHTLAQHMEIHSERTHECESCGKKFKSVSNLQRHMKVHGGEKTFHCEWPECDKSFLYDHNMKKHMRTHTGEKSYECQDCGKKFTDSSNLKKHSFLHSEGTFNCSVCDRGFKQPQSLKIHMVTHYKL